MSLSLKVITADQVAIAGARVAITGGSAQDTDQYGMVSLTYTGDHFRLTVSMTNYLVQIIEVDYSQTEKSFSWDDPGTSILQNPPLGRPLMMTVRLGRMLPAHTGPANFSMFRISDAEKRQQAEMEKTNTHQPPIVVPEQQTFVNSAKRYFFVPEHLGSQAYTGPLTSLEQEARERSARYWSTYFHAATDKCLLSGAQNAKGWKAFKAQPGEIRPQIQGSFTYVEWADANPGPLSKSKRFLVGLWRPRSPAEPGSTPRDVILFFHPTTEVPRFPDDKPPYIGNYPYALNQNVMPNPQIPKNQQTIFNSIKTPELSQRYVLVGQSYLWESEFLVHQLLAAQKDALLIFPIQPVGQWDILKSIGGVSRLLAEAILFERRQRRSKDLKTDPPDTAPERNNDGTLTLKRNFGNHLPPPALGYVTISGFSSGTGAIKQLMTEASAFQGGTLRTSQHDLRDPYAADPSNFLQSWREIWDIDGFPDNNKNITDWARRVSIWQQLLKHVQGGISDRIFRSYHTEDTYWTARDVEKFRQIIGREDGERCSSASSKSPQPPAAEIHGHNRTVAWFSNAFLQNSGPDKDWKTGDHDKFGDVPDAPEFWKAGDAHHMAPLIFFAHAAAQSKLKTLGTLQ